MSRVLRGALLTLAVVFASPWALSAQTQTEEELVREIERLIPLVQEAREAADAAVAAKDARVRAESEAAGAIDTFFVGDLRILAPAEDSERAARLFQPVWEEFADLDSEHLTGVTFKYQDGRDYRIIFTDCCRNWDADIEWWKNDEEAGEEVRRTVVSALNAELSGYDHPIYDWAPVNPIGSIDWETIYRAVAVAPARISRDCLDGDVDACVDALILDPTPGHLDRWYTSAERRRVAMRIGGNRQDDYDNYQLCRFEEIQGACDAILEDRALKFVAPYAGHIHASLVTLALDVGGDGSWNRLVDSIDREPNEVLEAVSGMSVKELVSVWYDEMIQNRPEVHAGIVSRTLINLFWFVFFATLALRSTRWRLG